MRDVLAALRDWNASGVPFAVATVVGVRGSAPRSPGAMLAVHPDGSVMGSVSGGCIEGAVYELAGQVLRSGEPALRTYGVSEEGDYVPGLTCGGIIDVLVRRHESGTSIARVLDALADQRPVAVATVVGGPATLGAERYLIDDAIEGSLGNDDLDARITEEALAMRAKGLTGTVEYCGVKVFVQSFASPPRLLVFGAIDFAAEVAHIGSYLGYRVTVCDARPVFATRARFPSAHEVVRAWPHDYLAGTEVDAGTAICVLTHDPKFDIPLLRAALRTDAGYIGVMGSRGTHADRIARLRAEGIDEDQLARLRAPVGLDLGARTPQETAVSIAAELIAARHGGTGTPLSELSGPIHRSTVPIGQP